jgi:hypothetical protein
LNDDKQDRWTIVDAAARLMDAAPAELIVLVIKGRLEIVRPSPAVAAGPLAEGRNAYDTAILQALGDTPLSSSRLARRAGHRSNSYFRERLAALVEGGQIRRTRRGYTRHGE